MILKWVWPGSKQIYKKGAGLQVFGPCFPLCLFFFLSPILYSFLPMGRSPPFFIFLRTKPFFFMGWASSTFKGLVPYCNFEPQQLSAFQGQWTPQDILELLQTPPFRQQVDSFTYVRTFLLHILLWCSEHFLETMWHKMFAKKSHLYWIQTCRELLPVFLFLVFTIHF